MTQIDYTAQAERELEKYIETHRRDFHAPPTVMDDGNATFTADLSIEEASQLISEARRQVKQARETKASQDQSEQSVAQRRDDISKLRDSEAERIQREWIDQSRIQAENYATSKNSGATPKSYDPNDQEQADIREGVLQWIRKTKLRGGLGGRKTLKD